MSSESSRDGVGADVEAQAADPYAPPRADTATDPATDDPSTLGEGVGIGIVILIGLGLSAFLGPLGIVALFAGIVQWVIVAPVAISWRRRGRHAAVKGLLIVAGIAFLLNATCTGYFMFFFELH